MHSTQGMVFPTMVNYPVETRCTSIQRRGIIAIACCGYPPSPSPFPSFVFRWVYGGAQGLVKDKVVLKRLVRQVMPAEVLSVSAKQAKQGGLEKRLVSGPNFAVKDGALTL